MEKIFKTKGASITGLLGKTLKKVVVEYSATFGDEIAFYTEEDKGYVMFHIQECCEDVHIESVVGDVDDLVGSPILLAEEVTNQEVKGVLESSTWTFYKLATIKGYVDIRWVGTSNGHYSESVDFKEFSERKGE